VLKNHSFSYDSLNKNKGFTLVELMITIGITAILATMAVPAFTNFVAKQKLEASVRSLVMTFSDARAQAATLRRGVTVNLIAGVAESPTAYTWLPKYTDISINNGTVPVVFNENGLARRTTGSGVTLVQVPLTFVLCSSEINKSKTVVLSRTGVVQSIQDSGSC
jgi:type IV fimbrial biogenesis protein FimT